MDAITIRTTINAPVGRVWNLWSAPEHIMRWNHASDDWHTTSAENDLREGGKFSSRMEAKDGSFGFDFGGIYDEVDYHKRIAYTMADRRTVSIDFNESNGVTEIVQTFDPESMNSVEMQRNGWQAILDNFRIYVEAT